MIIKEVRGKKPAIPEDCYVAENATIVGIPAKEIDRK
jgi:carbonic anhydrase/acetyltransferase-like protein (isoleucine patch superfamily)